MSRTYFGRRIKSMLEENRVPKPEILRWYATYAAKGHFDKEEDVELRDLLGLGGPGLSASFADLIPGGWFQELLRAVEDMESPRPFFVLPAMAVMGQLLGRDVVIDRGTHIVLPAVSVLLISPAGETRRSTACDFVIYELGRRAGLNCVADSFSYEAFGDALEEIQGKDKSARALIYAGEMSVMLGKGSYGESIIPKLTDLLGKTSDFEWRTVKRGLIRFKQPCLNAVLTTAPEWLADHIPAVALGGGLLSRFLTCVQEDRAKVVPWGELLDDHVKITLATRLRALVLHARGKRFARPEGEAMVWWRDWYFSHANMMKNGELVDERMRPYFSRKHDHLLRLAALLTVAAGDELVFTKQRFEQALWILDWLETDLPVAYSAMALSPQATAQRVVVAALERAGGGLEHSKLHRSVYRACPLAHQFKEVMQSLMEMGVVTRATGINGRGVQYILKRGL